MRDPAGPPPIPDAPPKVCHEHSDGPHGLRDPLPGCPACDAMAAYVADVEARRAWSIATAPERTPRPEIRAALAAHILAELRADEFDA